MSTVPFPKAITLVLHRLKPVIFVTKNRAASGVFENNPIDASTSIYGDSKSD